MSLRTALRSGPAVVETVPTSTGSALANPQFRLLFMGNVVTMMGFGMMQVVQGALSFDLTGKNSSVGFVAMGMGLPMLLLGPVGGALSDRMSKRALLLTGQAAVGIAFFLIGMLTLLDVITIWILAGMTLVMGIMFAVLMPARQAWVGDLLQGPALAHGVALQQLSMNGTRIVGPLLAGLLISIAAIGLGGAYIMMASFFVMATGLLLIMRPTHARKDRGATSVFDDLRGGLHYTWRSREVRLLMLTFAGVVLSAFSYQQLMPGFLENELGRSTSLLGVMAGAAAVGGIVTTLLMSRRPLADPARLMFICGWALGFAVIFLALSPNLPVALIASVCVGASSSGFQMGNQVNLMQRTDPAYFGRVMSLTMTAFGLQMVVGFPAGAVADAIGERATLAGLAVFGLIVVAAGSIASRSIILPRRPGLPVPEALDPTS